MQFKIPKDQDWFSQYNWVQFPREAGQEQEQGSDRDGAALATFGEAADGMNQA